MLVGVLRFLWWLLLAVVDVIVVDDGVDAGFVVVVVATVVVPVNASCYDCCRRRCSCSCRTQRIVC